MKNRPCGEDDFSNRFCGEDDFSNRPCREDDFSNRSLHKDDLKNRPTVTHQISLDALLDRFLRAWRGQDINDRSVPLVGQHSGADLEFPQQEAALKLAGVTADKVQFFRRAHVLSGNEEVAARLADPHYRGNILFVSAKDQPALSEETFATPPPLDSATESYETSPLEADERVELEYRVERFDSNNLVLEVQNTTGSPVWLLFSDVWHSGWSASVNGQEVPIYRGALAYKAVQVPPQPSRVHFRFAVRGVAFLYFLFGLCSLLWIGILAVLVARIGWSAANDRNAPAEQTPNLSQVSRQTFPSLSV